ncbi:MAG: DUF2846 domain-containing protein [Lysobacteraceae bacterium]
MRQFATTALAAVALSIAFGATAQDSAPAAEQPAAPAATQPAETTEASALPAGLQPPAEGMGQIVFFRPSKMLGAAIGFIVREGDTELGKLRNNTYFVAQVAPGAHSYVVHSEAKDVLNIEVEAGETYFVSGAIGMGILAGRPNISPSTQAAFEAVAGKLKPAKPLKD